MQVSPYSGRLAARLCSSSGVGVMVVGSMRCSRYEAWRVAVGVNG